MSGTKGAPGGVASVFFLPGLTGPKDDPEEAYAEIRATVALSTGHTALARRIWRLSARRGGRDCITEVGRPDPVTGELVVAILDLGTQKPFAIYTHDAGGGASIQELEIRRVYEAIEFAAVAPVSRVGLP